MLTRSQRFEAQTDRQVAPFGILPGDQIDLPVAVPVFQLLLARDGGRHVGEHLEMNETMDCVAFGEATGNVFSVLPQAFHQIGCNSDIQRSAQAAGEDVGAGLALTLHGNECDASWTLKQVQGDKGGICCGA